MKKWIQDAIERPGSFSEKAREHGESTAEFAREVAQHPEDYQSRTEKQARLAETLAKVRKFKERRG